MLNLFHAAILGAVEGLTEFLPISSTAHLILTANILKLSQTDYLKSFEIIIQLGAILAVVFLYFRSFFNKEILKRLAIAFLPTGILGWLFYKIVKTYLLGNLALVLWSLVVGGIVLILLEKYFPKIYSDKKEAATNGSADITYPQCLILGIFQAVAMIPGVSRSAAVIIGGLTLGISKKTIVEFSFLLAVPTMLAATGLDLVKNASSFNIDQFQFLALGFIISFLTALLAIRWLLSYIKNHTFTSFGIYRIILVVLFLLFLK